VEVWATIEELGYHKPRDVHMAKHEFLDGSKHDPCNLMVEEGFLAS
jgi:hypothetical protein